ncbi:hypothetical protein HDE78_001543 [Rhodanobacter sp. K2T2]|uniref:DUF4262 domain-containing protein n=1 Tax=Rhodanobacter sp. K2T2 TaxID=2723085 RepID=UPI0015C7C631|nr:DUF4262 domain-containing protein [Rhodanobacter sp. K2T2]NYE28587.1 hypothetical protein [Rhodanobacter sp. K2T2]
MDSGEEKALADIAEYGCHVLHVIAEGDQPPFSYTVGIQRTSSAPELVVIGLKQPIAHFVVNEYNRRVQSGEQFSHGQMAPGFVEGFDCQFREVHLSHYREYFGWDIWLYGGTEFRVLQLVYPTVDGIWPWDPSASNWFVAWQPVLDVDAAAIAR